MYEISLARRRETSMLLDNDAGLPHLEARNQEEAQELSSAGKRNLQRRNLMEASTAACDDQAMSSV
jgi:hypothetical protein